MEISNALIDALIKPYQEKIADLQAQLRSAESRIEDQERPMQSEQINEYATALAKAQAEFNMASLNAINPYFKMEYADYLALIEATRPALTRNGLSVDQRLNLKKDGQMIMYTDVMHSSGQFKSSVVRILPKNNDEQKIRSCVIYMMRLAYESHLGITCRGADDDAEEAVAETRDLAAKGVALNQNYKAKESSYETVTKEQLEELEYELRKYPDIATMVMDTLRIQSLADMPKDKFRVSANRIREISAARDGLR